MDCKIHPMILQHPATQEWVVETTKIVKKLALACISGAPEATTRELEEVLAWRIELRLVHLN